VGGHLATVGVSLAADEHDIAPELLRQLDHAQRQARHEAEHHRGRGSEPGTPRREGQRGHGVQQLVRRARLEAGTSSAPT
jgi:hypothetical protein